MALTPTRQCLRSRHSTILNSRSRSTCLTSSAPAFQDQYVGHHTGTLCSRCSLGVFVIGRYCLLVSPITLLWLPDPTTHMVVRRLQIYLTVFQSLHGLAPRYICHLLCPILSNPRPFRSSEQLLLTVLRSATHHLPESRGAEPWPGSPSGAWIAPGL